MIDLDELEALAREAIAGPWCVHPNGSSVCVYDPEGIEPQVFIAASGRVDEQGAKHMEYIAALSPDVVLELIDRARGRKTIDELIEASSLGTPEAKAIRAQAPPAKVQAVLQRIDRQAQRELDAYNAIVHWEDEASVLRKVDVWRHAGRPFSCNQAVPDAGYTWTWIAQHRAPSTDGKKITVHGNGNSPGECAVALAKALKLPGFV